MTGKVVITLLSLVVADSAHIYPPPGADPNEYSCDPFGREGLHLPHYDDCDKYYQCDNGREVERPCAPGTIFDFYSQVCGHTFMTQCILRTRYEGSGDDFDDGSIGAGRVRRGAAVPGFNSIINCNKAEEAAKQVAYRNDCQRYWRCVEGLPQVAYCSDGLFFNKATQQCDFEANSKCDPNASVDELQGEYIVYN